MDYQSKVEEHFKKTSSLQQGAFADEKLPVVVLDHFPALGKMVALRFLEWVLKNPDGVISLPTGKTPEHFIFWVKHLLETWNEEKTQTILKEAGIESEQKPDMKQLRFVQIDEFYPIDPEQHNSFYYYIQKYYIDGFGLDPDRAMLMNGKEIGLLPGQDLETLWPDGTVDLSMRHRDPHCQLEKERKTALSRIDQWCQEFEFKIREMGGIGFFLGGIGPDGHIGFNVRGASHFSTTHLTSVNYETQAASAGDLGGIEVSREKKVITIGLSTITYQKNATIIIMAAGEAKANVIRDAVCSEPSPQYPASILHLCPGSRFYITRGAAKSLRLRQLSELKCKEEIGAEVYEKVVTDLAVDLNKRIVDLNEKDVSENEFAHHIFTKGGDNLVEKCEAIKDSLIGKIERGIDVQQNTTFLHTEPHHDDLMLGYLPAIVRGMRTKSNQHHFVTLTSGFTAVSNPYLLDAVRNLMHWHRSSLFQNLQSQNYFDPEDSIGRNRDLWQYLDGLAAKDDDLCREGEARRFLRNFYELYKINDFSQLSEKLQGIKSYLKSAYPGKKDPKDIQVLKGMCREWEAECLWAYFGWNSDNVTHQRLGFYKGDLFTEEPRVDRDVAPVKDLLDQVNPDIVSVALDPEASGPDTHYKVMQAVQAALEQHTDEKSEKDIRVWGYRNVWFRFHPSEANVFVPASLNMLSLMESAFLNTYISQKKASFPSYEHDGPFCELAQKIQVEQYRKMKICLGRGWFFENPSPLIRATRGLVYLKDMSFSEFSQHCRGLRKVTENI